MLLPLLITFIALPFLPETIPAHYNFAGEVDRWGSKYETLVYPFFTIAMGIFMLWMAKISAKDENGKKNEKIVFYTGMGISVWFTIMHCYSLYQDFKLTENLYSAEVDISRVFCIVMGIGLVIIGNFMPKLKMNSLIGLRTGWSMKNEITWRKSQFFGGVSFMIIGILIAAAGVFMDGYAAMFAAIGLIVIDTIICVVYSYKVAKKY